MTSFEQPIFDQNFDNFDQPNPIMETMQNDNQNDSYTEIDPNENKMQVDQKSMP